MKVTKGITRVELSGIDAETLILLSGLNAIVSEALREQEGDEVADRINLFLIRLWNES